MSEIMDEATPADPAPQAPRAAAETPAPAGTDAPAGPRRGLAGLAAVVDVVVLVVLAAVLFWPGFAAGPTRWAAEAETVAITRAMAGEGVLAAPDSPAPLVHWLQAAAAYLAGGDTLAALRAPSLAAAVLVVLLTYAVARRLSGRVAGLAAGALAAASLLAGAAARLATGDALLAAVLAAAALPLAAVWTDPQPRRSLKRTVPFWIAAGLGLLVDGPLTVLVLVTTLAGLAVADRSPARIVALDPLRGMPLMLAVAAAGTLPGLVSGVASPLDAFGPALVPRVLGPEAFRAPPGTHALMAAFTLWPLSALLPLGFALASARLRPEGASRALRFLAAWVLPTWLVLEAVPAKPPFAVLPLMPGLAALAGAGVSAAVFPTRGWGTGIGFGFLAAGAVLGAFGLNAGFVLTEGHADLRGIALGAVLVLAGFAASWNFLKGRPALGFAAALVAAGAMTALAFAILLPAARSLAL